MVRFNKTFTDKLDYWLSLLEVLNGTLPAHLRLTLRQQDILAYMLENYPADYDFRKRGAVDEIRAYFRLDKPCFSMHLTNMHSKNWMIDGKITEQVLKLKEHFPMINIEIVISYEQRESKKLTRANSKQSS